MNLEILKETANMFWNGELTKLERMCIKSFVDNGFNVKLWSYTNLEVEGAESCDARLILPEESLTKYKQQHHSDMECDESLSSIAVFSDVFRYNVVAKFGGWWFDCDCFCLKHSEYFTELRNGKLLVAGLQDTRTVNVASGIFYAEQETAKMMVKYLNVLLDEYNNTFPRWGIVGPEFITDFVQRHKLYHGVTSIEKFYSINGFETHFFINSDLKLVAKALIKNSYVTHIWDSIIKYMIDKNNFPKGSLLEEFHNDSYNNNEDVNINIISQYNYILSRYLKISEIYDKLNKSISIEDMKNLIRNNTSDVEIVKLLKGRN
jgi:hypothetical protein